MYLKIVDGKKKRENVIDDNHGETLKIKIEKLLTLDKLGRKFVRDKKQLNHIVKLKDVNNVGCEEYNTTHG